MFPPRDCGEHEPAATYEDRWFTLGDVTPDQQELSVVATPRLRGHERVLHVGIGASDLARRWQDRVARIDGITVVQAEINAAPIFPTYRTALRNKYAPGPWAGPYDLIVDNNPGSFACCQRHARAWLDTAAGLLAPGGAFVTHARGCGYRKPTGVAMGWWSWWAYGRRRRLSVERWTTAVWAWRKSGAQPSHQSIYGRKS